jgi:flagellar protein FlaG
MDIVAATALTPVSAGPPTSNNRIEAAPVPQPTATGTSAPAAVLPVPVAPERATPRRDTEAIAKQLQEYLSSSKREVEFRVDADTGSQVVTVRDASTGDIIRQMPGEEVLRAFKNMNVSQGALVDQLI